MFRHLRITRPLAVIDLETTGVDASKDRIVEVSVLKVLPDGDRQHRTRRVNPGIPIPHAATEVHGITDADVVNEPSFAQVAAGLDTFLRGCDLCGFNIKRFDLRLLYTEFQRAGIAFDLEGRALVDPLEIFHHFERRDLTAAVRFYLDRDHDGAHSAAADVLATAAILDAMLDRYPELPRSAEDLHVHFKDPKAVDSGGKFIRINEEIRFTFGKYKGQPPAVVAKDDPGYLNWILDADFFSDTKELVRTALATANSA
jgi:DNA polymerase III subunit epsilon